MLPKTELVYMTERRADRRLLVQRQVPLPPRSLLVLNARDVLGDHVAIADALVLEVIGECSPRTRADLARQSVSSDEEIHQVPPSRATLLTSPG